MERGWGISDQLVYGVGEREIKIPLRLQNKSLVAGDGQDSLS